MSAERPTHGVPTLTEVVDWLDAMPISAVAPDAAAAPSSSADSATPLPISEEQLTQRVLNDLQRQIDQLLEYRLRAILTPLLARAADGVVRDARHELASILHDLVARAVARELSRHRVP